MKKQRMFDIVSLSDCPQCLGDNRYVNLSQENGGGMDPITIITGGIALLQSVFPGLNFGGRSSQQIAEDERRSMLFHQAAFLREYGIQLSNQIVIAVLRPGWDRGENGTQLWDRIMNRFYNENRQALEDAKRGIGPLVTGGAPGGIYTPAGAFSAYLPYLIGGIALIFLMKKK